LRESNHEEQLPVNMDLILTHLSTANENVSLSAVKCPTSGNKGAFLYP
jgi:hypothetical protein